jgi:hypothetical protein
MSQLVSINTVSITKPVVDLILPTFIEQINSELEETFFRELCVKKWNLREATSTIW